MNKVYRFYICSTQDLREECQIVTTALFKLGQFPFFDEQAIQLGNSHFQFMIKNIDKCDCMILLIGEKYGPIYENGISYIEVEYNYALDKNIPIICFIKNTNMKPLSSELLKFKERLLTRVLTFWDNLEDLQNKVFITIYQWLNDQNDDLKEIKTESTSTKKEIEKTQDPELISYQENLKSTLGIYSTKENNDIIGLMVNNLSEIKQFYKLTKNQADNAYKLARDSSIAGIGLIIIAILTALIFNNNQIAVATTVGGVVVEVLAGTSLFVYQKTLKQLNYYYASLHNNERFLSLINIVSKTNIKDDLYAKIVESELENLKQYEIKNDNTQ